MNALFITATDTDAGKTFVTEGLLRAFARAGFDSLGFKPVASGCELTEQGLRNEDALRLMAASSVKIAYEQVNPFAFEPAIAPHIAAEKAGKSINLNQIVTNIQENSIKSDIVLVEGVGGWQVPLNTDETIADLAQQLAYPVILVVNMRLGCINHALLTVQSIAQSGLELAGWVANTGAAQPMTHLQENIATLKQWIKAPLLAELPELKEHDSACTDAFDLMLHRLLDINLRTIV